MMQCNSFTIILFLSLYTKQLDEKSRYIKDLEYREKNWEIQMGNIKHMKQDLEEQLNQAKEVLHESKGKFDKEVHSFYSSLIICY